MSKRVRKITPSFLKKIIMQEARKLKLETLETGVTDSEKVDAEEVDASEYADSLEQEIDYIKVLKIHERKLIKRIKKIREAKKRLASKIVGKI